MVSGDGKRMSRAATSAQFCQWALPCHYAASLQTVQLRAGLVRFALLDAHFFLPPPAIWQVDKAAVRVIPSASLVHTGGIWFQFAAIYACISIFFGARYFRVAIS
jgi:hypothetical protein